LESDLITITITSNFYQPCVFIAGADTAYILL